MDEDVDVFFRVGCTIIITAGFLATVINVLIGVLPIASSFGNKYSDTINYSVQSNLNALQNNSPMRAAEISKVLQLIDGSVVSLSVDKTKIGGTKEAVNIEAGDASGKFNKMLNQLLVNPSYRCNVKVSKNGNSGLYAVEIIYIDKGGI